jgi:ribosomal protein L14E/L6E/L27E
MHVGQVVISKAGRDKGYLLVIVSVRGEAVFVCDGRERPLQKPKRKNPKHIALTNICLDETAMAGNRALRKALTCLQGERNSFEQRGAC